MTTVERAEMLRLYNNGRDRSMLEVAALMGRSMDATRRALIGGGAWIPPHGRNRLKRPRLSEAEVHATVAFHRQGLWLREVARVLDRGFSTIRSRLLHVGETMRPAVGPSATRKHSAVAVLAHIDAHQMDREAAIAFGKHLYDYPALGEALVAQYPDAVARWRESTKLKP